MTRITDTDNGGLKDRAYRILKERIVDCVYPPGTLLNEAQLAAEMNLSRTPLREAISKLEMDGLVETLPKKGLYVTNVTFQDVLQVFQARIEIEPVALLLAGKRLPKDELENFIRKFKEPVEDIRTGFRLDTAMHLFIIEQCGNRFIIEMMRKVFDQNTRIIISSKQNQIQIHGARQEHLEILELLYGDLYAEAAEKMRAHVESCRRAALDFFCNNQVYDVPADTSYRKELEKMAPR